MSKKTATAAERRHMGYIAEIGCVLCAELGQPGVSAEVHHAEEIWMPAYGFDGYQASSDGRVRSVDRWVTDSLGRKKFYPGKVLSQTTNSRGYKSVYLANTTMRVNRLVLMSFYGPPSSEKTQGNHINGIKSDNRIKNLEWCTPSENIKHSYQVLGNKPFQPSKGKFGSSHHNSKPVIATPVKGGESVRYDAIHEAQRRTGLDKSNISAACRGVQKTCGGYRWEFA